MRLDTVTAEIRPRSDWEAVDLGFAMVRRSFWRCISTSLSKLDAPKRNRCGCSHSSPTVSATVTRYLMASFEVRMPPAGFTPIFSPVNRYHSPTICSMSRVTGRVAAGATLPVEVLMKSPPARIASQDARRTLS